MISEKILNIAEGALSVEENKVQVLDEKMLPNMIDELVAEAVFGSDEDKLAARWIIWEVSQSIGNKPASINDFYMARGREELPLDFTVPAINVRAINYDMSQTIFNMANKHNVGAMIFEIARSEMGYTDQTPSEYVTVILAAAIKSEFKGPIFIQGDHFQTKKASAGVPVEGEVETIKKIIDEAVSAGFYNIDIDTSTLVDLDKPTEEEQQEPNIRHSLEFAKYIRGIEPEGVTISLGGEIGHIGGVNSTVEDFEAYVKGFNAGLPEGMEGMSKISIQTGTSHGGVVLADGTLADLDVDFSVLDKITKACRKLGMGGAVQHGASTLPDEFFNQFTKAEAVEVHLATGFQNIIFDHPSFPAELKSEMYAWLDENKQDERKEDWTDEQFHYKLRKKSIGQFKKEMWNMDEAAMKDIREALENRFEFMFTELNVVNTKEMVEGVVKPTTLNKNLSDFSLESATRKQVRGLSD